VSSHQQDIDALVRRITEIVHPLKIILFGSRALGQEQACSDVDLLVVVEDGAHRRKTAQKLYTEISGIKTPYDILVATEADLVKHANTPGLIYRDILRDGKLLYAA
jgi:uncharacterized protein